MNIPTALQKMAMKLLHQVECLSFFTKKKYISSAKDYCQSLVSLVELIVVNFFFLFIV